MRRETGSCIRIFDHYYGIARCQTDGHRRERERLVSGLRLHLCQSLGHR